MSKIAEFFEACLKEQFFFILFRFVRSLVLLRSQLLVAAYIPSGALFLPGGQ